MPNAAPEPEEPAVEEQEQQQQEEVPQHAEASPAASAKQDEVSADSQDAVDASTAAQPTELVADEAVDAPPTAQDGELVVSQPELEAVASPPAETVEEVDIPLLPAHAAEEQAIQSGAPEEEEEQQQQQQPVEVPASILVEESHTMVEEAQAPLVSTTLEDAAEILDKDDRDAAVEELLEQAASASSLHGWSAPNTPEALPESPMPLDGQHAPQEGLPLAADGEAEQQPAPQSSMSSEGLLERETIDNAPAEALIIGATDAQEQAISPSRRRDSVSHDAQQAVSSGEARQLVDELKQQLDSRIDQLQGLMHVEEEETDDKLNLMRESFQSALLDLHNELHQHLHLGMEHLKDNVLEAAENRTIEEVARVERDVSLKVRTVAEEVRSQWHESLNSAMDTMNNKLASLFEQLEEHKANCAAQLQSVAQQLQQALSAQNVAQEQLQAQILQLSAVVDAAMRAEVIHPPIELPTDGQRLRVIVTVEACAPSVPKDFDLMVPISVKATVGMFKREVLRRAANQLPSPTTEAGAAWRYSCTDILDRSVLLFEEDTLEDIDLQTMAAPRLTLRSRATPPDVPSSVPSVGASASQVMPIVPGAAAAASPFTPITPAAVTITLSPADGKPSSTASRKDDHGSSETSWVPLRYQSLPDSVVASLAEHESLDRRLMAEVCRMELQPILDEERIRRADFVKAKLNRLRMTLLDRATYSHVESHRRACRSELDKLDNALNASATPEEANAAVRSAEMMLQSITSTQGEENRVEVLQQAAAAERRRKERLVEDIKDQKFAIQHQLRVPSYLFGEAEKLSFACDRAAILASTITVNELDDLHRNLSEFIDRVKHA